MKIDVLMRRAMSDSLSMLRENMLAVWPKPCSARTAFFDEDVLAQLGPLGRRHEKAAGAHHFLDQLIGDAVHAERFLLGGADDVVVERGAGRDVARRLVDVGGLVDDDRR